MNTEKLEKLKKSLDNKFIPDSMKDKIRTEIQKLESEIKQKEITPTEIKEEVKNIEEKVEEALEVAEKKEEKQEESKPKTTKKATTGTKKTAMALAKKIRKEGESWTDAVKRAGNQMKGIKDDVKKETKSEIEKLKSLIRKRKDLKGVSNSNIMRDGHRKALPMGKRTSATGHTYYENRRNHADIGKVGELYLAKGGNIDYKHNYMMLSRLQMDCEYYLNYGNRNEKVLWAGNVDEQIEEMKRLWNSFPKDAKPEWLTMNQILDYEKQMKNSYANGGSIPNNYEGKTPEQVWDMWTPQQREHFLADHYDVMDKDDLGAKNKNFSELNFLTQSQLELHIEQGQYANGGMMSNMSVHDGTDFMNTPVYHRGGALPFENGGGFDDRDKQGMIYALQEHVSSGEIANMTDLLTYDSIAESRSKAIEYYVKYGDKPYSMTELKKVLSIVSTPLYHKYKSKFEDGGDFMSGVYAEDGAEVEEKLYYVVAKRKGQLVDVSELPMTKNDAERFIKEQGLENFYDFNSVEIIPYHGNKKRYKYENGGFMNGVYAEDGAMVNKDGIRVKSVSMPEKELTEAEWLAKHNESREARAYAVGGGIFADTFTGTTGTHYTGLVGETNAMSSGEMFMAGGRVKRPMYIIHDDNTKDTEPFKNLRTLKEFEDKANELGYIVSIDRKMGWIAISKTLNGNDILIAETLNPSKGMFMAGGRVRRTKAQITRDRENKEIDAYNWYVVDLETNRAITGNEYKEDAVDVLSDYDDKKRYKVVSKKTLKSLGIENPNESWKSYEVGGGVANDRYEGKTNKIVEELKKIQGGLDNKPPYVYVKNGLIYVSAENGDNYADYDNYLYIDEKLEEFADKYDTYWDWEDAGSIVLTPLNDKDEYADGGDFMDNMVDVVSYYDNGGAIANQQLIADAHLRPAEMFGREGIPAYKRGGRIKYNNGGEYSQYGKFIASQIEYLISLKTIASKKEPIQNLLKNMDNYRGTEIEKRITTDNLKYALQQKTVSKMNEVLRISLNALKD